MKKLMLILIIGVFAVALAAQDVFAFGGACGVKKGDGACGYKGKGGIEQKLDLTAEQKEKLDATKAAQRDQMKKLSGAMKEERRELKEALAKPDATKATVAAIASEIKKLQAEMVDKRIDGILAVKQVLTPEQYAKLQEMKENRMNKMNKAGRKERGGKRWQE